MVRLYERVMGILEPLHLHLVRPNTKAFGFLTGDTPVVIVSGLHVGNREGVGIGNSQWVYLPLGRWLGVLFGSEAQDDQMLAPAQVQIMNLFMRRSCLEWMAAHPDENIPRALGQSAPLGWPPDDQCSRII